MSRSEEDRATVATQPHDAIPGEQIELAPREGKVGDSSTTPQSIIQDAIVKSSKLRSFLVVITICGVPLLNTMQSGLLTVGLPSIALNLQLTNDLLLWLALNSSIVSMTDSYVGLPPCMPSAVAAACFFLAPLPMW
jgi:hypothetical protein